MRRATGSIAVLFAALVLGLLPAAASALPSNVPDQTAFETNGAVNASPSRLYVGGTFTQVGARPRQGYAQFTAP